MCPALWLGETWSTFYPSLLYFSQTGLFYSFYESSHCSNSLFCFDFIFASDIFSLAVGQILAHRIILMKNSFLLRLLTAPLLLLLTGVLLKIVHVHILPLLPL